MKINKCKERKQSGATLVELMVSVFIFSIGVLGFASLQSRSIQAGFDTTQRDQVVWLTQSLFDRIRANNTAQGVTAYEGALNGSNLDRERCDADLTPNPMCSNAANQVCTNTQMAEYDVWDLYCSSSFQGADVIKDLKVLIECDDGACNASPGENYQITTNWCARNIESESVGSVDDCVDTVAEMEYRLRFRP